MRFVLAVLVGRVVRFFGGFVKRATNLPGEIALRICPDLLGRFRFRGKVIAVTGSNGKTTTTNMIAHILRENGHSVAVNAEGANLSEGVATTLLTSCRLNGELPQDFVVLEVDERFAPIIFGSFTPDYFVITNLFRDQVVRNGHPDIIYDKLSQAIRPGMKLILNGNDPLTLRLGENAPFATFGMERTPRSSETQQFLTDDCKVCPKCFRRLRYDYYHYNHLGAFRCERCGYETPALDYRAEQVDFDAARFSINGVPLPLGYNTAFYVLNTAAAVAVCAEAGVVLETAVAAAGRFQVSRERYDEMALLSRKAVLILTKQNSASLDQSISYTIEQPGEKTALLFVNNVLYTDKKDISWLYDVSFERLRGKVDKVVCTGSRAYDLAVRLRLGGFTDDELLVVDRLADVKARMGETKGAIYILAASAFGDEDGILEALQ